MKNQEVSKKKPFYKKWWIWGVGVFILITIIGSGGDSTSTTNTVVDNDNPQITEEVKVEKPVDQTQTTVKTDSVQKTKSYQQVFTFSGNGNKKSEPFTITGSRFKVKYDCAGEPDFTLCQAFVYEVGSSIPEVIMNTTDPVKDETIIYGSGEYYIEANTIGNYTMVIEDYR